MKGELLFIFLFSFLLMRDSSKRDEEREREMNVERRMDTPERVFR